MGSSLRSSSTHRSGSTTTATCSGGTWTCSGRATSRWSQEMVRGVKLLLRRSETWSPLTHSAADNILRRNQQNFIQSFSSSFNDLLIHKDKKLFLKINCRDLCLLNYL